MKTCVLAALAGALVLIPAVLSAQGNLNSGGGTRSSGTIQAVDALGTPVSGTTSAQGIVATSGLISDLPIVTPVTLRTFHVLVGADGVVIRWEGAEDTRFTGFFMERAEAAGDQEPEDAAYERINRRFPGAGPHEYIDAQVQVGRTYYYRLGWMNPRGVAERVGPWSVYVDPSAGFKASEIYAARPNPFQGAFVVSMFLSESTSVNWSLVDLQGRVVLRGGKSQVPPGFYSHRVTSLRPLSAGVYFLRVVAGSRQHVQKIVALP